MTAVDMATLTADGTTDALAQPAAPGSGAMVNTIKWIASVAQIGGYTATGFGFTVWALPFFAVGLVGWLTVGFLWRDKAIVLLHLVAMAAMLTGLVTRG